MDDKQPTTSAGDYAYALAKAGISQIPIIGAPASEILPLILAPPLERRRTEWLRALGERLKLLEAQVAGFKLESLRNNETFITTALHASQAAIRNHQQEKLEALRNSVLNSALPNPIEEDLQLIFIDYIDSLTPLHLKVLRFLDDPKDWGQKHEIHYPEWSEPSAASALELVFPELAEDRWLQMFLIGDLYNRGLIDIDSLQTRGRSKPQPLASRTTQMGKKLLHFITSPINEEAKPT